MRDGTTDFGGNDYEFNCHKYSGGAICYHQENGNHYICACGNLDNSHIHHLREFLEKKGFLENLKSKDELFAFIFGYFQSKIQLSEQPSNPPRSLNLTLDSRVTHFDTAGAAILQRVLKKSNQLDYPVKLKANPQIQRILHLTKSFNGLSHNTPKASSFRFSEFCPRVQH
ncbi:MAG: hypothetical protein U9Q06_04670 [Nanoarchaeota archaeon]|nr:hypothetical protein [Nanoarchaeota archaeon]